MTHIMEAPKVTIPTYDSLPAAIAGCFGPDVRIEGQDYVGGGDINDACCLRLSGGVRVFVKSNTAANFGFFEAEAAGLGAIAGTKTIGTPKLLALGLDRRKGVSFLMMELVSGRKNPDFWEDFGHSLAKMHLADTEAYVPSGKFGFHQDNFIGAGPQENAPTARWIDFFRQRRLEPQFRRAKRYFDGGTVKRFSRLLDRLETLLVEPKNPSLLHGDLWSGNYLTGPDGRAWLIDPAAYVGHAEADLAMTELFGGFSPAFYGAYREINALEPGYPDRRDLYNLYHLLNHLNLFGPGYLPSVRQIIGRFG